MLFRSHVARGPYRVVSTDGPTVLLDVDGEHRRENVAHVVRASGTAAESPAQHPALRAARSFHGAEADGQRYAVDRIANHATLLDGTLRVQVYWTGYPHPNWMDAANAAHEKLRVDLRRAARLGLPHTSANPPPAAPSDSATAIGTASSGAAAPPQAVRALPLGSAERLGAAGGKGEVFRGLLGSTGPSRHAGRRTLSGRTTRESTAGRRGERKHKLTVSTL